MELQKKQMALTQKEHQLTDAKRFQQLLEVQLLEGKQQKETTWNHNQVPSDQISHFCNFIKILFFLRGTFSFFKPCDYAPESPK